jgi:hypothetical protein
MNITFRLDMASTVGHLRARRDTSPTNPAFREARPEYGARYAATWTFKGDIKMPMKILRPFRVDLSSDLDCDTWVRSTIL